MFKDADIAMDENGQPILIIPTSMPDDETTVILRDGEINIIAGNALHGRVENVANHLIVALSVHEKLPICIQPTGNAELFVDRIAHIKDEINVEAFEEVALAAE